MAENTEEQPQDGQNNDPKYKEKFQNSVRTVAGLIGGPDKLMPSKRVSADGLDDILTELFAEKEKLNKESAKNDLRALLDKYADFQLELKNKLKEIEKLEKAKMEDFTKAAEALLQRLEGARDRSKLYYEGLKSATAEKGPTDVKA